MKSIYISIPFPYLSLFPMCHMTGIASEDTDLHSMRTPTLRNVGLLCSCNASVHACVLRSSKKILCSGTHEPADQGQPSALNQVDRAYSASCTPSDTVSVLALLVQHPTH